MLRYIPNSPNTFNVPTIIQNLSNLPGLVTNNIGMFFPGNTNPTQLLLEYDDSDVFGEDEPLLLRLKKEHTSRSYFDMAGKIFGRLKNWTLKNNYNESVNLNPIMHDWLKKLCTPKCGALALKLNNWIAEYLTQPTPFITQPKTSSSNNIEGDDTQLLEERKQKKIEEEEEILRQYQNEQGKKVQQFISLMTEEFLKHDYWFNSKEQDLINLEECIERYVIVKIFRKIFIANKITDFQFWQLLQTYQFIVPKHLDIKVPIDQSLLEECHQDCCIIIFNYLEDINHQVAGVDEFLPILTYIIIKTAPSSVISNLRFIEDFRREDQLLSSWGYFLSNVDIAVHFVNHLNPKQLSTGHEISSSIVLDWTLLYPTPQSNSEGPTPGSPGPPPTHQSEQSRREPSGGDQRSPEKITKQRGDQRSPERKQRGEKEGSENMTRSVCVDESKFDERYKFWNYSAEDIKKEDITELLNEYKRLALVEYKFLSK